MATSFPSRLSTASKVSPWDPSPSFRTRTYRPSLSPASPTPIPGSLHGMTRSKKVTVEKDGHVLLIGINRPEKRNAFDLETIDALGTAYDELGTNDDIWCGVLFGHGAHFSGGLDLAEVGPVVMEKGP